MTTPVILVAGFSQAARQALIRDYLNRSAHAPALAWLDHQDQASPVSPSGDGGPRQAERMPDQSFHACVCCSGSLVFSTHLSRLLRRQSWAGIFISLGARAEPGRMLDLLRQAPWNARLGPIRLFSVIDELGLSVLRMPGHVMFPIAEQQRTLAECVLTSSETLPSDLFGED